MAKAQVLAAEALALRSTRMVRLIGALFARDLASSFHAVRLLGTLPVIEGPLVIFANHPSWWDAELFVWLAATTFADRRSFAPMEADMMERYRFFARVGAFPVSPGSFSGAATFLATAERVLQDPTGLLFVNAEGRFRDIRSRPIRFMPGLAHLARRVPAVTFVPLALEYPFWDERRPNLLLRFGEPLLGRELAMMSAATATARLCETLEMSLSVLADAAQSRDPLRFHTMLEGRVGINALYDFVRFIRAFANGRRFSPKHGDRP